MTKRAVSTVFSFLGLAMVAHAQEKAEKIAVFVVGQDAAGPVAESLKDQMNASKPFRAVAAADDSKIVVLVHCVDRTEGQPFACMYVASLNGATLKTFFGAGLNLGVSPAQTATDLFESIIQDVLERYDSTSLDNLRQAFESCLLFSDGECNVPEELQKEMGAQQMGLREYLLRKKATR
jgi:hypothetical protein